MDTRFSVVYIIVLLGLAELCLTKDIIVYSGHIGETLTVYCPYQQHAYRWGKKIWCKEVDEDLCELVISARFWHPNVKINSRNTSISDNKQDGILTINMTNLQRADTGLYQCRINTFGDVRILHKIQVQVLEDPLPGNMSEFGNVQYSISGGPTESQVLWTMVILGSTLLLCKLLVMGLIYSWWKSQDTRSITQDTCVVPEALLSTGTPADEWILPYATEETDTCPQYINYVYMGHLKQTY